MMSWQHDEVMANRNGWWLPSRDSYMAKFIAGPPRKNGFFVDHLQEAFKHVRAWDVAVDVGSHVGFWSSEMAQRFKTVYAFEPSPVTYDCFLKNMADCDNVIARNVAVGDQPGRCRMQSDSLREENSGSAYIVLDQGDIEIVRLDDLGIPACDLLKVDVEGYELRVLQGAKGLIRAHWPVIIMECTDRKFHRRFGIPIDQAQVWLKKNGYREVWASRPDKVFVHY